MNPNDYQKLAERTECDQLRSRVRMFGVRPTVQEGLEVTTPIRLNHSIVGLAGEVGELASLVQKWIYYGKQFTREELLQRFKDEFGDALWYIAEGLNALGLSMDDVMEANIAKLKTRYPEKYSDDRAEDTNRDREAEARAVENGQPPISPVPSKSPGRDSGGGKFTPHELGRYRCPDFLIVADVDGVTWKLKGRALADLDRLGSLGTVLNDASRGKYEEGEVVELVFENQDKELGREVAPENKQHQWSSDRILSKRRCINCGVYWSILIRKAECPFAPSTPVVSIATDVVTVRANIPDPTSIEETSPTVNSTPISNPTPPSPSLPGKSDGLGETVKEKDCQEKYHDGLEGVE